MTKRVFHIIDFSVVKGFRTFSFEYVYQLVSSPDKNNFLFK